MRPDGDTMRRPIDLEAQYCAQNYRPLPVVLTRGEGVYVWDDTGKKYLDMMSAYSAVSHGHANPRLVRLVQEQVATLNIVSRAFYTDKLGPFLERVCELTRAGYGAAHEHRAPKQLRPRSRRRASGLIR